VERRTLADLAFHPDPTTVLLDDAATDEEPQAHAVEALVVHVRCARETLENLPEIRRRDPDARVLDGDACLSILLPDLDLDRRALRTVLPRVLDQVLEELLDPTAVVQADDWNTRLDLTANRVAYVMPAGLLRQSGEVDWLPFANEPALFEPRRVEQVADEPREALALSYDAPDARNVSRSARFPQRAPLEELGLRDDLRGEQKTEHSAADHDNGGMQTTVIGERGSRDPDNDLPP